MTITYEKLTKSTLAMRIRRTEEFNKELFFCSDVHIDNPKCQRELFFTNLKKAQEKKADVFILGDLFCLMQGKFDPRRSKKDIRPEHNRGDYLDAVVNDTAELLLPYIDVIKFISLGNHETAVLKNLETNVTERLVTILNHQGGQIHTGTYGGFIWIQSYYGNDKSLYVPKKIFYYHGKWGGQVTKGVLGAGRMAQAIPDADMVITGHTHDHWSFTIPRYRLKQTGELITDEQVHLKCGTYKDEQTTMDGWFAERIFIPKSFNMWWVNLYGNTKKLNMGYYPENGMGSL